MGRDKTGELSTRADQAMRIGDIDTAISCLESYVVLTPDDHDHWLKLAGARRAVGDLVGALDASAAAVRCRPDSFLAMLLGASLLDAMGRQEEATRAYRITLDLAPDDTRLPDAVQRQLARGRALCATDETWRQAVAAVAIPAAASPGEGTRIAGFRDRILGGDGGEPGNLIYPGLDHRGFHEAGELPGIAELEESAAAIRAEFETLAAQREHSAAHHAGVPNAGDGARHWSVISLWRDGEIVPENAALCPITMRLYEDLRPPRIAGRSPNLMFSILAGGSKIPPHRGVTNTRLVLHLPLILPRRCGIRVADETRQWSQGRAMVFDDTFEHEVWNDSDQPRVILLGDLWHPDLSEVERVVVADLLGRSRPEDA